MPPNKLDIKQMQAAQPKAKPYKLSDGFGLYLLVQPSGAKYWRLKYRFAGKEQTLSLGVYPKVSLEAEHCADWLWCKLRRTEARA